MKENIIEFNTRSLSAQESRVVLALRERGQREVTRADIVKLLGASLKAADKVTGSLRRKGWLERAAGGEYLLKPPERERLLERLRHFEDDVLPASSRR